MRYYGCAYYPEYWGAERVGDDARLMREAGINIVRIGEFAWCRMEPEEGRFTLDWLHDCVETLARRGIDVLMCTPTAAPPAWLTQRYPDTLLVKADGTRAAHGGRRHYCPTSPTYRSHVERIVEHLTREMSRHANVVAWQIDNELGHEAGACHCESCQARFQAWLKERYGSLEELNRRWGTGFWSMDYSAWEQLRLDSQGWLSPSRLLDSKRFRSDMWIEFAQHQATIIRRNHPGAQVTTNGMGPIYDAIDYYRLFSGLDVASDDLYFDIGTMDTDVAAMNVYRSLKPGQRYWITETGSGALDYGRPPRPEQLRTWAWSSYAHGAEAYMIFRWRTCLSGQEQELQGILEHSGHPGHRYRAVQKCFLEMRRICEQLGELPLPEAPVAIVQDYDVLWAYESSVVGRDVDYPGQIYRLHRELYDRHVVADVIPPGRDLSGYRLVILPSLVIVSAELATRLAAFVEAGGTVLATGQLGLRDGNANYVPAPGPQHLEELFGVHIQGGMYLHSHVDPDEALWVPAPQKGQAPIALTGVLGSEMAGGRASVWAADLTANGGTPVLKFTDGAFLGQPAVVEKRTGKGHTLYAGVIGASDELHSAIVGRALSLAGVQPGPETRRHVEVLTRGQVTFAINHTTQSAIVRLGREGKALLGTFRAGVAELPPYGVCIVR
ncbi:MAG: beta-galactosidase [Anaerolineae bacterium]|nr:beta-galactosidase [Anaerolineae bacterium]